jgi:hypothetical protein
MAIMRWEGYDDSHDCKARANPGGQEALLWGTRAKLFPQNHIRVATGRPWRNAMDEKVRKRRSAAVDESAVVTQHAPAA